MCAIKNFHSAGDSECLSHRLIPWFSKGGRSSRAGQKAKSEGVLVHWRSGRSHLEGAAKKTLARTFDYECFEVFFCWTALQGL